LNDFIKTTDNKCVQMSWS